MSTVTPPVLILTAVAVLELAAVITLAILLVVSQSKLKKTRQELEKARSATTRRRRRRLGVAPLAIKTAWETADSLINKGFGATVRNSIEDLAGWARVERPDLARLTADGQVVIMFSDIEGSTERNEELGDKRWVQLLERHNKLVTKCVDDHGGHVVKNQGDGFMIAFADPHEAVLCGVDIQRALQRNADKWADFRLRIGAHMGTSVRRGDDLFGRNVAMAARVAALASGGEILVSAAVHEAVDDRDDISLGERRDVELKGLSGTHAVYPVSFTADVDVKG